MIFTKMLCCTNILSRGWKPIKDNGRKSLMNITNTLLGKMRASIVTFAIIMAKIN